MHPKEVRTCTKRTCLGNVDGICYAKICKGAIVRLDKVKRTPEEAEKFYEMAKDAFEKYFGEAESEEDELE